MNVTVMDVFSRLMMERILWVAGEVNDHMSTIVQAQLKFLESILLELRKAGFLESKKGKNGGYFFAVAPSNIKLSSIFRIIEGPIALLPCVSLNFYEKCADCNEKKCGINKVMIEVRDNTLAILDKRTVADLNYKKIK